MNNPTRSRPARRITKKLVDSLKPAAVEFIVWDMDIRGFGVKVTPAGRKVYLLKYRTTAGRPRKPAIGTHGDITADQARTTAGRWKSIIADGGDPSAENRETRRAGLDPTTHFENVVERFIERHAKPRQKSWKETRRVLLHNCADWKGKPIGSISKADAFDMLEGFIAEGRETKARLTLSWLKTMFRWGVRRGILDASVVEHVSLDIERRRRDRVYTDDEINAVWKATDALGQTEGAYVKLCVLLAVRRMELAGMRRCEFDNRDKPIIWTIPHERTKTRKSLTRERVYIVPLPDLAQRIIRGLPKGGDLLFPGRKEGKPFWPGTDLKTSVREKSGVADWSYHACRHTIASWLKDQGHSEYERGLVLNHAESSVTAAYSHGYPVELKRRLLEKWAQHVAEVVQPKGAVLLS